MLNSTWQYGILTTPSRRELLTDTVQSLYRTGFERPYIFSDGLSKPLLDLPFTNREKPAGAMMNWFLAAWELYARDPHADLYAIFEDDILACADMREYIEMCPPPPKTFYNLYTMNDDQTDTKGGWRPARIENSGAQGYVFANAALRFCLFDDNWLHLAKGYIMQNRNKVICSKCSDAGVRIAMRRQGHQGLVHSPSLLQHAGYRQSTGESDANHKSSSWRGEDWSPIQSKLITA